MDLSSKKCWCGKKKSFSECHAKGSQPTVQGAMRALKFKPTLRCYCTGTCNERPISSHTISRRSQLERIARNGHVIQLFYVPDYRSNPDSNFSDLFSPKLIGIKEASCDELFCERHDAQLFNAIDVASSEINRRYGLLLAYRAACANEYGRRCNAEFFPTFLDAVVSCYREPTSEDKAQFEAIQLGLKDAIAVRETTERHVLNGANESFRSYVLYLNKPPPLVCNFLTQITYDISGKSIQPLGTADAIEMVHCSWLITDQGSVIVLSWEHLADNMVYEQFVSSIQALAKDDLVPAFLNFILVSTLDVFLDPKWWKSLTEEQQALVLRCHKFQMKNTDQIPSFEPCRDLWSSSFTKERWLD